MPPGPCPFPYIGNLLQLGSDPLGPFNKLVQKYGDIFTVTFPIGTTVVINSAELAREARLGRKDDLDGRCRDTIYPFNVIFGEKGITTSNSQHEFVFRKKIFKSGLHVFGSGIEQAGERVERAVQNLLKDIEAMEGQPFSPKKFVASAIISQMWEWISSKKYPLDHPTVKMLYQLITDIAVLLARAPPYRLIPWLSYLPTTFNRKLKDIVKTREKIFVPELQAHRNTYTSRVTRDLIDSFIGAYEKETAKETSINVGSIEDIQSSMLEILDGASHTSSTLTSWFILYVLLNQDVQRKIHQELDRVVGRDRLPRWQDAKNLPYLQATLCEVLRHSRLVPVLATNAIRDTTIGGYHIPKRTAVLINICHIHRDEKEWSEADSFKPERFLDDNGMFIGWTAFRGFMPFGIGRRECPGQALGKIIIFSFTSALMHRFKLEFAEGEPQPSLEPSWPEVFLCPKDYKVVAKKRM